MVVLAVLGDMHGGDGAIGSNSHNNTPFCLVDGGIRIIGSDEVSIPLRPILLHWHLHQHLLA